MLKFTIILWIGLVISFQSFAQNAPITKIGNITSCPGIAIEVPVTVSDFNNIGVFSLTLGFDPAVLTYSGFINTSGFPILVVNEPTPGEILAGGFIFAGNPGISLPDESELFILLFEYSIGTTDLVWIDDGESCEYGDEQLNVLNDLPTENYYINGSVGQFVTNNAPKTHAPTQFALTGTTIEVPVTVDHFCNIGAISLRLDYNPDVLAFQGAANTAGFPGLWINNPSPGMIKIGGFNPQPIGVSYAESTVLFTLSFSTQLGTSPLTWFDDGESCEYTDNVYVPLNDEPYEEFYFNGEIIVVDLEYASWSGNVDNDWFNPNNWIGDVPTTIKSAIIPNVGSNPYPMVSEEADCYELNISEGAQLTIGIDGALTNHGPFSNYGQLVIESDQNGDGSFIDHEAMVGTGDVIVKRYIDSERWHYISPPISNAVSGIFLDLYLTQWGESTGEFSYIIPTNIDLNVMEGYGLWASDMLTGSTTIQYIGSLNTGELTSATLTTNGPNGTADGARGFNFVGNPYPSAVDWNVDAGWNKSGLANAIYIWNPEFGNYGSYVDNASTNLVTNIIPSGQGFFVHVPVDGTTGSLSVNNNARTHSDKPFFKSINNNKQLICLEISGSQLPYKDQTVIAFDENATNEFDDNYDAYDMLAGIDEAPSIYTLGSDQRKISINTLPVQEDLYEMPLFIQIPEDGFYTINTVELNGFGSTTEIALEDLKDETSINLIEQSSYSFSASVLDDPARFMIHFKFSPNAIFNLFENELIHLYSSHHSVILESLNGEPLTGELFIHCLDGKLIKKAELRDRDRYNTAIINQGIYLVKYVDTRNQKIYRHKVIVN